MPALVLAAGVVLKGNAPAAPGQVEADATGETTVTISWTDDSSHPANATSFLVEISEDGDEWETVAETTATTINDTGLTTATLYYYRVTARNVWGDSIPLGTTVTTESSGAPLAPSNLVATALSSSSIGLAWTDNSNNEDNFELQRATDSGFTVPTTLEPVANAVTYTDLNLTPETEYFYRIRATNGAGDSSYSATDSATTLEEGAAAEFELTAVADATVGVTADIAAWYTTYNNPSQWWMWQVRTIDLGDSGVPGLLIASHRDGNGARLYEGNGSFGFTENTSDYGVDWDDMNYTTGGYMAMDLNHNGKTDLMNFSENAVKNALYSAGSLTLTAAPWQFEGDPGLHVQLISELQPSGYLRIEDHQMVAWPTTLTRSRWRYDWNGSAYTETKTSVDPPTGIPQEVLDEIETYLDDGSQVAEKRFLEVHYNSFDLDGDGTEDDLLIQLVGSYGGAVRGWYLTHDGDGTFTDQTAAWGLPTTGIPLVIRQKEFGRPFEPGSWPNTHPHIDISGGTRPDLFLATITATGNYHGHYRWNGSGYTRLSNSITTRLALDDSYQKRLYAVDLTNSGHLDLVLQRPRTGEFYIFLNDGSGNFTEYNPGRQLFAWDADGLCIDDLDGDGLPEFVLGGDGGSDSGVTSSKTARCLSVWDNTTSTPGNYLGIKIRRTGHPNFFGVSARIDVHTAGQSFSAASLIRRWYARPDGLPLVFGVGGAATVDYRVTWPDATTTSATAVNTNQTVTVTG